MGALTGLCDCPSPDRLRCASPVDLSPQAGRGEERDGALLRRAVSLSGLCSSLKDILMSPYQEAWLRHQQQRWLRPDAARWVRPDAARFLRPGTNVTEAFPALARKYNPSQPRVPAGRSDGGQRTDGTGAAEAIGLGLFQIAPLDDAVGGVQLAGEPPAGDRPDIPTDAPPEIPQERPGTSAERTRSLRAAASWLVRHGDLRVRFIPAR